MSKLSSGYPPIIVSVTNHSDTDQVADLFDNDHRFGRPNGSSLTIDSGINGISYQRILCEIENKGVTVRNIRIEYGIELSQLKQVELCVVNKNAYGIGQTYPGLNFSVAEYARDMKIEKGRQMVNAIFDIGHFECYQKNLRLINYDTIWQLTVPPNTTVTLYVFPELFNPETK